MTHLERIRNLLPDAARDIKLNLQMVLQSSSLSEGQLWGVAITSAAAARNQALKDAMIAEAQTALEPEKRQAVIDDAIAAASLMAMNNVYYRFRHLVGKPTYAEKAARLRMNRLAKPATDKLSFELNCLAASAINGCETCMRSHERVVVSGGLSEDAVHDAIRIAATLQAAAVALELVTAEQAAAA